MWKPRGAGTGSRPGALVGAPILPGPGAWAGAAILPGAGAGAGALVDLLELKRFFTLLQSELEVEGWAARAADWDAPATAAEMDLGPPARTGALAGGGAGPETGTFAGAFRG